MDERREASARRSASEADRLVDERQRDGHDLSLSHWAAVVLLAGGLVTFALQPTAPTFMGSAQAATVLDGTEPAFEDELDERP